MSALLQNPVAGTAIDDVNRFTTRVSDLGGRHTVHVGGELDLGSRRVMVRACLDGNHDAVEVDATELTFMDCTGYGALVEAREALERRGGSLTLIHAGGEPAFLLKLIDGLTLDGATGIEDESDTS